MRVPRSSPRIPRQLLRTGYASKRNSWKKSVGSTKTCRASRKPASRPSSDHTAAVSGVAGGDVMPNLGPLGWRQYRPQGLVRSYETIEPRGPILAGPPRRLVEEEDPAATGVAADCLHQAQLVLGREVMDRQAAPGPVGMLRPPHHRLDEVAVIEIDFERQPGKIGGGELERWL